MSKFVVVGRRITQWMLGLALVASLAACGGGGNAGTSVFTPDTSASGVTGSTATANDLVIVLSKSSLTNTGSDTLTATVTAIDANRAAVAKVPVSFSINSNAVVTPAGTATGTDGTLAATVSAGADTSVRTVSITATSGSVTRTVSFDVVQVSSTSAPQAADLSLALDVSSINNSGSVVVNATAVAVDGNRNALAGIPVQFSVDSGAIVVAGATQTDGSGKVTGVVSIGSDHSNRTISVTAKSGSLTKIAAFRVVGAALQATAVPTVLTAGTAGNQINYTLVDVNKNPMSNQAISVSASGLPSASGTTDSNGQYTYTYTAPSSPGAVLVSASAGGASASTTVTVPSGTSTVPTVTTPVSSATLTLSANVVGVNSAGTNNIVSLSTVFASANSAPIANIRVRYDLNGDPNSVGGTIGAGTNLIYTDATGTATSTYAPGAVGSPSNGLTIRACWDYADFAAGTCPNQAPVKTLTVTSNPVSVSIGYDNTVGSGSTGLTYVKKFVVTATDSANNPKSDVQITVSMDLNGYYKGYMVWDAVNSIYQLVYQSGNTTPPTVVGGRSAMCANEDVNRNNLIDTGEDANGSTHFEPRKSDVSVTLVGSTKTDSNGTAVVQIEYPKNYGNWVDFTVSANAAGVLSPPATYTGILPVLAADLTTQTPPPAFVTSPYGKRRDTSTDATLTEGGVTVTNLCVNSD